MAGHSYQESKGIAFKTIIILAVVTVIEVLIALTGKGYLIPGFVPFEDWMMNSFNFGKAIMYIAMITMSLYKAMLVIFEFMHMKYEVKGLMRSVLFPTALLIWAIIAFFLEGDYWRKSRDDIQEKNIEQVDKSLKPKGEVKKLEEATDDHH